jgi:hypothetical protein
MTKACFAGQQDYIYMGCLLKEIDSIWKVLFWYLKSIRTSGLATRNMVSVGSKSKDLTKPRFGHQSRLPLFLYPLSFAPPLRPPWVSVHDFFTHPWILYSIGVLGILPSSVSLPVSQYLQGFYWIPGVMDLGISKDAKIHVGVMTATYQAAIVVTAFIGYFVWLFCCKS